MTGKVSILGAGAGAADLLTVRATEILRVSEVVLHDELVSAEVLALCSPSAEIIHVGKRCGQRGITQEQIEELMISHARAGRHVVRLKSGDPGIFGRLGEELEALRDAEVPFEIIPGVTAAAAAAAAAEITLTDRRFASRLLVLSGHTAHDETRQGAAIDLQRTTVAVYMPGPDYGKTARELVVLGIDAATPCALVSNAGRNTQQVRFLSLEALSSVVSVVPPAVLIVGEVARRDEFSEMLKLLTSRSETADSVSLTTVQ